MLQRDFLLRWIERAIRLLHLVTGLIELKQHPEALRLLDEGYEQFFGFDLDTLNSLPLEYLLTTLREGDQLDAERCLLLAALQETEGDLWELRHDEARAVHRWHRALALRLAAWQAATASALPREWTDVEALAARMVPYDLGAATSEALFNYFERVGKLARAEDWLWRWREAAEEGTTWAAGMAFYQRLLAQSDATLLAAGLPRTELVAGLAEWEG